LCFGNTGLDCYVTYKEKSDLVLILLLFERKKKEKILRGSGLKAKGTKWSRVGLVCRRRKARACTQLATEEWEIRSGHTFVRLVRPSVALSHSSNISRTPEDRNHVAVFYSYSKTNLFLCLIYHNSIEMYWEAEV
jgi:hypothetical protein